MLTLQIRHTLLRHPSSSLINRPLNIQRPLERLSPMLLAIPIMTVNDQDILRRIRPNQMQQLLPHHIQKHTHLRIHLSNIEHTHDPLRGYRHLISRDEYWSSPYISVLGVRSCLKLEGCNDTETCFGAAEGPEEVGFAGSPDNGAVELDDLCIEHVGGVGDAAVLGGEPGEAAAEGGTANAYGRGACADD